MMKMVKYYIDELKDEMHGAKNYAEKYVEYKTSRPTWGKYYKTMAEQELVHAGYIKEMAQQAIDEIKATYIGEEDMEAWTECMNKYADCMAVCRIMVNS